MGQRSAGVSKKKPRVAHAHPCSKLSPEVQRCEKDFKLNLFDACCLVQFFRPFPVPLKLSKELIAFLVESKKRNSLTQEEVCSIRFALTVLKHEKDQVAIAHIIRSKVA